jgi:hypothetical protein
MAFDYGVPDLDRTPNQLQFGELHAQIRELVSTEEFTSLYRFTAKQVVRQKDVAFVLAYLSLRDCQGLMTGSLKSQVNAFAVKNWLIPANNMKALLSEFMDVSRTVFTIFGEHSFRKYHLLSTLRKRQRLEVETKSRWGRKVNQAFSMSLMVAVSQFSSELVAMHAEAIRETVLNLISINAEFAESLRNKAKSPGNMALRIAIIKAGIRRCINEKDPELFPFKVKQQLFEESSACVVCKRFITHIDDSHVSHQRNVAGWSVGGEPTIDHGQLTHRLCNYSVMRGFIHPPGSLFRPSTDRHA